MGRLSVAVRRMHKWHTLGLAIVLLVSGCSSLTLPMNEPLRSPAGNAEYRLLDVNRAGGAECALVLVALSGGGKRSAAFAFGVLRGMRDIPVRPEGKNSTLLDEIDFFGRSFGRILSGSAFWPLRREVVRYFPRRIP
jgi:NTE family protein